VGIVDIGAGLYTGARLSFVTKLVDYRIAYSNGNRLRHM
jgi:hypothetical protein